MNDSKMISHALKAISDELVMDRSFINRDEDVGTLDSASVAQRQNDFSTETQHVTK